MCVKQGGRTPHVFPPRRFLSILDEWSVVMVTFRGCRSSRLSYGLEFNVSANYLVDQLAQFPINAVDRLDGHPIVFENEDQWGTGSSVSDKHVFLHIFKNLIAYYMGNYKLQTKNYYSKHTNKHSNHFNRKLQFKNTSLRIFSIEAINKIINASSDSKSKTNETLKLN